MYGLGASKRQHTHSSNSQTGQGNATPNGTHVHLFVATLMYYLCIKINCYIIRRLHT